MLAAIAFGIPIKRRTSGNNTRKADAITLPHKFRIPPIITMERIKIDSSGGATNCFYFVGKPFDFKRAINAQIG